jgi:hypothetical protein
MECNDNGRRNRRWFRVRKEITSSLSDAKEARPIVLAVTADTCCDHKHAPNVDQGAPHYKHIIAS